MAISTKQKQLIELTRHVRHTIAHGAVRSGKTEGFIRCWPMYVLARKIYAGRQLPFLISGRTQDAVERNVVRPMVKYWGPKVIQARHRKVYVYGCPCDVFGADNKEAYAKVQGSTYAGWFGNEITLQHDKFVDMARTRLSEGPSKIFWDCNPESPYHHVKIDYIDKADGKKIECLHFMLDDNPFLEADFVHDLKTSYSGVFYERYIEGKWVIAEGVIYRFWNEELNETTVWPGDPERIVCACDYGTADDPCTFGKYYLVQGRWYKVDEYYYSPKMEENHGEELSDREYGDAFDSFIGDDARYLEAVVIDPSAASLRVELSKRGYNVVLADNEVLTGIRVFGGMIKHGSLAVYKPRCPNILRERTLYRWDEDASRRGITRPLKKDDHTMDEGRYFAMYVAVDETSEPSMIVHEKNISEQTMDILQQMGLYS